MNKCSLWRMISSTTPCMVNIQFKWTSCHLDTLRTANFVISYSVISGVGYYFSSSLRKQILHVTATQVHCTLTPVYMMPLTDPKAIFSAIQSIQRENPNMTLYRYFEWIMCLCIMSICVEEFLMFWSHTHNQPYRNG